MAIDFHCVICMQRRKNFMTSSLVQTYALVVQEGTSVFLDCSFFTFSFAGIDGGTSMIEMGGYFLQVKRFTSPGHQENRKQEV